MANRDHVVATLKYCLKYGTLGGRDCWRFRRSIGMNTDSRLRDCCPNKDCPTGCVVTLIREAIELLEAPPCADTVYRNDVFDAIARAAHWADMKDRIAALPSVQPVPVARVMTLEEVEHSYDPMWIEGCAGAGTWAMLPKKLNVIITFVANTIDTLYPGFAINEYGQTWRCWTSRPTDAQIEATPWN